MWEERKERGKMDRDRGIGRKTGIRNWYKKAVLEFLKQPT